LFGREVSVLKPERRLPLVILAVILTFWEPVNLAFVVSPRLSAIASLGWGAVALVFARVIVASVGIAAGLALWRGAPGARLLASVALVLSALAAAVTIGTSILPSNVPPGDAPLWIALIAVHNFAWLAYLRFCR
jgi:hypothetical protein